MTAAAITPADRVLEPSAGTGLLAILAEIAGGSLILNELAETRADLLDPQLFPAIPVTRFDAAQIDDHLDPRMCPRRADEPAILGHGECQGRMADAAYRHVASALARLAPAGGWSRSPAPASARQPAWRDAFVRLAGTRAASCSPPPSTARSMPSTARRSTRG
jgi:hypothetical protein